MQQVFPFNEVTIISHLHVYATVSIVHMENTDRAVTLKQCPLNKFWHISATRFEHFST